MAGWRRGRLEIWWARVLLELVLDCTGSGGWWGERLGEGDKLAGSRESFLWLCWALDFVGWAEVGGGILNVSLHRAMCMNLWFWRGDILERCCRELLFSVLGALHRPFLPCSYPMSHDAVQHPLENERSQLGISQYSFSPSIISPNSNMSTAIYPPLEPASLRAAEKQSTVRPSHYPLHTSTRRLTYLSYNRQTN